MAAAPLHYAPTPAHDRDVARWRDFEATGRFWALLGHARARGHDVLLAIGWYHMGAVLVHPHGLGEYHVTQDCVDPHESARASVDQLQPTLPLRPT